MYLVDLYVYSKPNQYFNIFAESDKTRAIYRGDLKDCPSDILEEVVSEFQAIDFDTINVILAI